MFDSPIDFVKAGKLTTTIVAAAIDPTGLVVVGATAEAILTAHEEFSNKNAGLAKITKASQKRLKKSLQSDRFENTDNMHGVLWMKLTHCAGHIADPEYPIPDADEIFGRMRKRLQSFDNRTPMTMAAFQDWMLPELRILCDDPDLLHILGPAIERHKAKERKQQTEDITSIKSMMENPNALSDKVLADLATRFGLKDAANYNRDYLLTHLHKTAEDFQRIASELAKFEAKNDHISQLHAQALKALENFDRLTAKSLLTEAKKQNNLENLRPALETNANLSKTEAEIALLDGDAETAYQILSATADSFAAIDPTAPTSHRLGLFETLYNHGLRYGGNGLSCAAQMNRDALQAIDADQSPDLFARAQNNLALALQEQGSRTGGQDGADLLAQAVAAYRAALRVRTEDQHPVQWATTQNNLANALRNQGSRTGGQDGADLLAQAVTAYRAALRVRTEDQHPVDWAMTQNNLANALAQQGIRTGGQDGADLLAQAVTAYRAALRVRTEYQHPVQWATTQENLAIVYQSIASHDSCGDPQAALKTALTYVDATLRVYDPVHMPYNHGTATTLRDEILAALNS